MAGRYLVAGRGDARGVVQPLKVADLAALHQRDDHAGGPGAGRTARAVQVVLVVVRRVEVHDQVDVVYVDAARRDVGGDQDAGMPGGERGPRAASGYAPPPVAAARQAGRARPDVPGAQDRGAGCSPRSNLSLGSEAPQALTRTLRLRRTGPLSKGLPPLGP
jgi:hypothetical protein